MLHCVVAHSQLIFLPVFSTRGCVLHFFSLELALAVTVQAFYESFHAFSIHLRLLQDSPLFS